MTAEKTEHEKLIGIARGALDGIRELVEAKRIAKTDEELDAAIDAIYQDPLSITVRDGWRPLGDKSRGDREFRILLSTGGPATQIIGDLDQYDEPINCKIQAQDWFLPWETLDDLSTEDQEVLDEYCAQFCFYEE